MRPERLNIRFKLTTYRRLWLLGLLLAPLTGLFRLAAQAPDPASSIKNLHQGVLIVRFPTYSAKIDTLKAMISRSREENNKQRLQKWLKETMETRDTLLHDYIQAFRQHYHFSQVAYFYDVDAHDLDNAVYYNLDGKRLAPGDLADKPLFYLYFERTEESKIDALVIYNRQLKRIPRPFPGTFSRGGINFLFLKIAEKNFPAWRVSKMHKSLVRYYNAVMLREKPMLE